MYLLMDASLTLKMGFPGGSVGKSAMQETQEMRV